MCRRMMKRRWKVWRLEVGRLMHARAVTVLTRRQPARSSSTASRVSSVGGTAARQTDAAAVTGEALLRKRELFETFLMKWQEEVRRHH